MLRPMVATTAVTAALILVAGCGGNDKKSDGGSDSNGNQTNSSASPTAPSIPTFDPPKAFAIGNAYPVLKTEKYSYDGATMAIVGKVAVISSVEGLSGHDVTDPSKSWTVKAVPAATTTVNKAVTPKAVKVDGKDVAVAIYSETDKGNGTQKPQGLVVIQWIDVATGDKIAETSSKTAFPEASIGDVAYDVESGQVVVGTAGPVDKSGDSSAVTLFADPATKKATQVPGISPAAVHDGAIAGSTGPSSTNANDASMAIADGPSGKVTKKVGPLQTGYENLAGGGKHAYFKGSKYVSFEKGWTLGLYAVDLSTGAVTTTPLPGIQSSTQDSALICDYDAATSVVCTGKTGPQGIATIIGLDDTSGKKAWGFTDESGNRNVPDVTAAYHGVLYAQTEAQAVLIDAKTGADLPSKAPSGSSSPSTGDTPSDGDSPTAGDTPSDGGTPSDSGTPSDGTSPGNGDLGLWAGKLDSPESVSPYGGIFKQAPHGDYSVTSELDSVCIFLKATA
jgi:hypothetical protein